MESDLRGAVDRGEIVAHYQPQIDLVTGRIVAVEALSRWRHPRLGLLASGAFIPVAEENGLIHQIGRFMMEEGCRCAAALRRKGMPVAVSVNVSTLQMETPEFSERLVASLTELALPAEAVTVEVTESRAISNLRAVATRLGRLRMLGLGISIDDFGSGFASLAQLENLPATEVKIDRSLVHDDAATRGGLLEDIVELGRERGLRVVAEGVETEQHLERVRTARCDRAQGYLIAKPMPMTELEAVLDAA